MAFGESVSQGPLKRGDRLGRHEIRQLLGQGGMGQVYRAWDFVLNRDVALKTLGTPDEELIARFACEADAIGRLNHPNVVRMHEFHADPEQPYIVMEYLRGEDLSTRLNRGPMELGESVELILGVCSAVHACHGLSIIHRDIKPANVFLHQTPEFGIVVKVLDFGVAMLRQENVEDITRPGNIVGTARYLAPEQVEHLEIDARLDQYGIGLLAYMALAGRSPFSGIRYEAALMKAILKAEYPQLRNIRPDLAPALLDAVERAMDIDRRRRFSSVLDLGKTVAACAPNEERIPPEFLPSVGQPIDDFSRTKIDTPMAELRTEQNSRTLAADSVDTLDGSESLPVGRVSVVPIVEFRAVPVVSTTALLPAETATNPDFDNPGRRVVVEKTAVLDEQQQAHWQVRRRAFPPPHSRPIIKHDEISAAVTSEKKRRKLIFIVLAAAMAALIALVVAAVR
jgi:serine/threonine protein kinase